MEGQVTCRLKPDLYAQLGRMAEAEHRSISQQMAYLLSKQLEAEKRLEAVYDGRYWVGHPPTPST